MRSCSMCEASWRCTVSDKLWFSGCRDDGWIVLNRKRASSGNLARTYEFWNAFDRHENLVEQLETREASGCTVFVTLRYCRKCRKHTPHKAKQTLFDTFWILLALRIGETWIIGGTKEILLCFTLPFFRHSDSRFAGVSVQDWQGIPERPGQASLRSLSDPRGFPMVFLHISCNFRWHRHSCAAVLLFSSLLYFLHLFVPPTNSLHCAQVNLHPTCSSKGSPRGQVLHSPCIMITVSALG